MQFYSQYQKKALADNKIKGLLSGYLSINNRDLGKTKLILF